MNTSIYMYEDLKKTAAKLLSSAGLKDEAVRVVAEILVEADLMGHTTHGINLLPAYVNELASGGMRVQESLEIIQDNGSAVLWDGKYMSGIYLTYLAIQEALERSKELPVVTYSIRRAHHIGCLAAYMPMIVEQGRLGILAASDPNAQMVAPFGGKTPVYSPNPIAAGIPSGPQGPIIVDISTSVTAGGVVNRHRENGTPLPGEWLLDADGNPTNDPNATAGGRSGSMMPLGGLDAGYKGYALGLIIEALTSGLGGYGRREKPDNWGTSVYLQIINPEAFSGLSALEAEMSWLSEACRSAKPRPGYDEVRVPGDRALERKKQQLAEGVEVTGALMNKIRDLCISAGIETPQAKDADNG